MCYVAYYLTRLLSIPNVFIMPCDTLTRLLFFFFVFYRDRHRNSPNEAIHPLHRILKVFSGGQYTLRYVKTAQSSLINQTQFISLSLADLGDYHTRTKIFTTSFTKEVIQRPRLHEDGKFDAS